MGSGEKNKDAIGTEEGGRRPTGTTPIAGDPQVGPLPPTGAGAYGANKR